MFTWFVNGWKSAPHQAPCANHSFDWVFVAVGAVTTAVSKMKSRYVIPAGGGGTNGASVAAGGDVVGAETGGVDCGVVTTTNAPPTRTTSSAATPASGQIR
jgi:hypothetical protein